MRCRGRWLGWLLFGTSLLIPGDLAGEDKTPLPADTIVDNLNLEYHVEVSTGPGRSRTDSVRFVFKQQESHRFVVEVSSDNLPKGVDLVKLAYRDAYGEPILVTPSLVTPNGIPLQFQGLCPLRLGLAQRKPGTEVVWVWDGAGVEPVSTDPNERIQVRGHLHGPLRWGKWDALALKMTDVPPTTTSPVCYYEQKAGLLVGVEYGADLGQGGGRFIYCDAVLERNNAGLFELP